MWGKWNKFTFFLFFSFLGSWTFWLQCKWPLSLDNVLCEFCAQFWQYFAFKEVKPRTEECETESQAIMPQKCSAASNMKSLRACAAAFFASQLLNFMKTRNLLCYIQTVVYNVRLIEALLVCFLMWIQSATFKKISSTCFKQTVTVSAN